MRGESLINNLCNFSVRVEVQSLLRLCEWLSYNKGCCTLCICQVWPSNKCTVDTEQLFQLKLTLALSIITPSKTPNKEKNRTVSKCLKLQPPNHKVFKKVCGPSTPWGCRELVLSSATFEEFSKGKMNSISSSQADHVRPHKYRAVTRSDGVQNSGTSLEPPSSLLKFIWHYEQEVTCFRQTNLCHTTDFL